jgi:hypothetical protein
MAGSKEQMAYPVTVEDFIYLRKTLLKVVPDELFLVVMKITSEWTDRMMKRGPKAFREAGWRER